MSAFGQKQTCTPHRHVRFTFEGGHGGARPNTRRSSNGILVAGAVPGQSASNQPNFTSAMKARARLCWAARGRWGAQCRHRAQTILRLEQFGTVLSFQGVQRW
jgi:hypothetical protein